MNRIAMTLLLAFPVAAVAGDHRACTHATSLCVHGAKAECDARQAPTRDCSKQACNRTASVMLADCPCGTDCPCITGCPCVTGCPSIIGSRGHVSLDRALNAAANKLPRRDSGGSFV
jgi:hypothetical protein